MNTDAKIFNKILTIYNTTICEIIKYDEQVDFIPGVYDYFNI